MPSLLRSLILAVLVFSVAVFAGCSGLGYGGGGVPGPDGICADNPMTVPFLESVAGPGGTLVANNLSQMQPLGNIFGPHVIPTAHIYLDLDRTTPGDHSTRSVPTDILSPGTTRVVAISRHDDSDEGGATVVAYRVTLKICANTYFYIDHINALSGAITAVTGAIGAPECEATGMCYWQNTTSGPELAPGDVIGTTASTHAIDVGAFDPTYSAPFITPGFYHPIYSSEDEKILNPSKAFKKCALDYFVDSARNQLLSLNPRTANPRCGDFAQDLPGRAQGTWLPMVWYGNLPLSNGIDPNEVQTFNLTHDSIDPSLQGFSIGTGVPRTDADGTVLASPPEIAVYTKYYFVPATDPVDIADLQNRSFADIPVGNEVYCYRNLRPDPWMSSPTVPNLVLLVQMRTQGAADPHTGSVRLRVQARERSTCPPASVRHLNTGFTAEFFRD